MLRRLLVAVMLLCFAQQAHAASSTLGNLSAGSAIAGTDLFYDVQSVGSGGVKVTATQLTTYLQGSLKCGATTNICFNSSNTFGGDSGLTYAGSGGVLTLTPAANTAQPFLVTGGSTTGSGTSTLGLSVVGTLNTTGVVDGAALFGNVTNTASGAGSLIIDLQAGGASVFSLGFDTPLIRDAAATIAQRNATTAQTLRVYNTFTSTTSYERGIFDWNGTSNVLTIGTEKGSGGGSVRNISFIVGGTDWLNFGITTASTITVHNTISLDVTGNTDLGGTPGNGAAQFLSSSGNTLFYSGGVVGWSTGGLDVGFSRNAAGVVEVNGGTKGTITGSIKPANFISGGSVPVDGGGSCTVTGFAGGATAGTFVGPVGACAAGTVAITFALTAPTGWSCDATDRTTSADSIKQTATTATKATFLATLAASDVVQYKCTAY